MTCRETRDLYSALLDEALDARERAALEAHVAGCAECARELERFRRTVSLVRAAVPVRAPVGFVDRVLAATRPAPWYRRFARRLFWPLQVKLPLEAAALLLVGGMAMYVFQHTPELQQAARHEAPRQEAPAPAPGTSSLPATPSDLPGSAFPAPPAIGARPERGPVAPSATESGDAGRPTGAGQQARRQGPMSPDAGGPDARSSDAKATGAEPGAGTVSELGAVERRVEEADPRRQASSSSDRAGAERAGGSAPPQAGGRVYREQAAPEQAPRDRVLPSVLSDTPPGKPASPAGQEEKAAPRARQDAPRPAAPARSVDVAARLTVADPELALRGLAELLDRAGGREVSRRPEGDVAAVDVLVPREHYADFLRGLAQLGRLSIEREPGALPGLVRVTLRIGG